MTLVSRASGRFSRPALSLLAALSVAGCGGGNSGSSSTSTALTASGFSPAVGAAGTLVTLTGSGLGGATEVDFGGTAATGLRVNSLGTRITVTVPAGTGTVPVTVLSPAGSVAAGSYSYTQSVTTYVYQAQFGDTGVSPLGELRNPFGIAADSAGNVYVADGGGGSGRIVEFSGTGAYVTQFGSAQFGTNDTGPSGQAGGPQGVAVDSAGSLYVTDSSGRVVKFSASGTYSTQFGNTGTTATGRLNDPYGIATDSAGNVYVTDVGNGRVVKFSAAGVYLAQFGDTGATATGLLGSNPIGVAVDGADNVYVNDTDNNRVVKYSSGGTYLTQFGDSGTVATGRLGYNIGIATGGGNVYVGDSNNIGRVVEFTGTGAVVTQFGGTSGVTIRHLDLPQGVAVNVQGDVYVTEGVGHRVVEFAPQITAVPATRPKTNMTSATTRGPSAGA